MVRVSIVVNSGNMNGYESLRSPFEDMGTPPQTKMKPKECDLM